MVDDGATREGELGGYAVMNGTANLRLRCVGDEDSIELSVGNGAYGSYTGPGTYTLDGTGTFGAAIYRAPSMTTFVDSQFVVPSSGCVVTVVDAPHGMPPRGSRIRGTLVIDGTDRCSGTTALSPRATRGNALCLRPRWRGMLETFA